MKTSLLRAALACLLLTACGPEHDSAATLVDSGGPEFDSYDAELRLPSQDFPQLVDVGSWNVEWFGSPDDGPTDEALQQANVKKVLRQTDLDLVGLVEVVSPDAFAALLAGLPNHDGLLVTDPRVEGGASWYSAKEQKVALLFKKRFRVVSARVVLTEVAYQFGGRPPLEVKLAWDEAGAARTLVVLVAHFKAMANADGYARRKASAEALHAWLDATYPSRWVMVIGDWNDDLSRSTYRGATESPFTAFTGDPHYRFTTDALSASRQQTTATFSSTIDHHLVTDDLAPRFVEGSATVLHPEGVVAGYAANTSDHYPVVTRYDLR
ncbi:MAG: endonuclease/exonuclease/phosphatase family protein [Myxococcota bacterium]